MIIRARPIPNLLHLVVNADGRPFFEPGDRGSRFEYAYTVSSDRPEDQGAGTVPIERAELERREATGSVWFVIDPGRTGDGLMLRPPVQDRPRFFPVSSQRTAARPLSGVSGLRGAIVAESSVPGSAWTITGRGLHGAMIHVVIDDAPIERGAALSSALGHRPHHEIVVVDAVDALPRVLRGAATAALASR